MIWKYAYYDVSFEAQVFLIFIFFSFVIFAFDVIASKPLPDSITDLFLRFF